MRCRSEWHSPAPATRRSSSPGPGSGVGTSTSSAGCSQAVSRMAFMGITLAHELKSDQFCAKVCRVMSTWLKLVLRVERAIAAPVEAAVHSDAYFDVVAELNRGTRRVTDAVES